MSSWRFLDARYPPDAVFEGYRAALAGQRFAANPYPTTAKNCTAPTDEAREWARGFWIGLAAVENAEDG